MNSVQGGDESISCNVDIRKISLAQENNAITMDEEIPREQSNVIIYGRRKRLKKAELADRESFNEGDHSSLGNMHQTKGSIQPVESESVPHDPHLFSSSTSEKTDVFEDGICAEVIQKSLDESLQSSSGYENTSLDKNDGMLIDKNDTSENGNDDTHALMLPESRAGNGNIINLASTETDIEEQSLSELATTERKSCDSDMLESNHVEELHGEATKTVDALGRDSRLSHADLSLVLLDGTQGVASEVVCESTNALAGCKQKKLLVLDINGLLIDISSYIPYNYDPDDIIMKKAVFRRPHCDDFLNFCFEKFNVGFWTSRTEKNMEPLLEFILGNNKSRLLFSWDQSHCTDTGYYTVEKKNKPLLLKKLKKLWDKCEPGLPWEIGVYNESNTLLLDDTPYKALTNPRYTAVFPYTYRYTDVKDNSLGPGGDLRVYLEGLAEADNVQEYVKQNPFGQRPITEKNLSWGYYRKVIAANSTPPREPDTIEP